MKKTIKVRVFGLVQGIGYRNFVKNSADNLNIKGYVSNNEDGSVTVAASGDAEKLEEFKEKCKKGPKFANVNNIEFKDIEIDDDFTNFEIRI